MLAIAEWLHASEPRFTTESCVAHCWVQCRSSAESFLFKLFTTASVWCGFL